MKSLKLLVLTVLLAPFVAGCDSGPRPPETHYVDPNRPVAAVGWSMTDLKIVTDQTYTQLVAHCAAKIPGQKPKVMISRIDNRTQEIIDTEFIGRTIFDAMSATGTFELIDAQAREDIAAEYQYQQSGYVDPAAAKGPGHQLAADYMLRGRLTEIVNPKGWSEVKSYTLQLWLTDIEKGSQIGQWRSDITKVIER